MWLLKSPLTPVSAILPNTSSGMLPHEAANAEQASVSPMGLAHALLDSS